MQAIKTTKNTSSGKKLKGFTNGEHAAMKEYVQELRAHRNDESRVLAKIAEMKEPDRTIAKRVHAVIKASALWLTSRLWYGMREYAKDDKVVCFFQPALKFKSRYATLGFSDKTNLDDGTIRPVVYAVKQLTPAEETKIASLVKKAIS